MGGVCVLQQCTPLHLPSSHRSHYIDPPRPPPHDPPYLLHSGELPDLEQPYELPDGAEVHPRAQPGLMTSVRSPANTMTLPLDFNFSARNNTSVIDFGSFIRLR